MRSYILLSALAAITLGSCSTAYKTGQTPDDVYYSPTRPQEEYVVADQKPDDHYYGGSQDYYTDRYLRMRMTDPYRWSALDDYYFNNPYAYNYYSSYSNWYSPWNNYWAWNTYCNPYYVSPIFIKNPVRFREVPSRATVFNPRSYINTAPANIISSKPGMAGSRSGNGSYYNPSYNNGGGSSRYNNSNSGSSRSYSNSNSNNSNSGRSNSTPVNSTPTRSYNPPPSSSSSSSGSRSTSAPTRPPR